MQRIFLFLLVVLRVLTKISPNTSSGPAGERRRGHWQRAFHAPCRTLKELGSNQIHSFSPSDEEGSTRFTIRIGIPWAE